MKAFHRKGTTLGAACWLFIFWTASGALAQDAARWSAEKANAWQTETGWLVGCNFIPSTAINELEMWQADTFDPPTIDRELGWAEGIGFNSVRVFLHNLPWQQDSAGFLNRIEQFLQVADKHHIRPMFVIFDSCWDPNPKLGPQHPPVPFRHNSGWVQAPGNEYTDHPERLQELKPYVEGVIGHFRADRRIAFWDLYNEPDNINENSYNKQETARKRSTTLELLRATYRWAREANPSQPVSSGVWKGNWPDPDKLSDFEQVQLGQSDIVTFHCYANLEETRRCVDHLRHWGRPIVCTEYMARPAGSTFDPILGYFKEQHVGAYNWGFVSGKTQTIFPWDSWTKKYTAEPPVWFHDIFHSNGLPYRQAEVNYIRKLTLGTAPH